MPRWVTVRVSDKLIIKACNTPSGSGGVARSMNKTAKKVKLRAVQLSPRNNPMNATHRGGVVGTYQRSFKTRRYGNGHILVREIWNTSDHAAIVEDGRRSTRWGQTFWEDRWPGHRHWLGRAGGGMRRYATNKRYTYTSEIPGPWETFGWTKKKGAIMHYAGTSGRTGQHILDRAFRWGTRKYAVTFVRGKKKQVTGKKVWR
jgi:hypothetical protein